MNTLRDIQRAIERLTAEEVEELRAWLDERRAQPIDRMIQRDLAAGRLDGAIRRALDDDNSGHVQPLTRVEIEQKIARGLAQIERGETVDGEEAFRRLRRRR